MVLKKQAAALALWTRIFAGDPKYACSDRTVVLPHNTEYRYHCENTFPTFDLHYPCFTHRNGGNLRYVHVSHMGWDHKPERILFPKDGDLVDFTLKYADKDFSVEYSNLGFTLYYGDRMNVNGRWCFKVVLEKWKEKTDLNMWITQEDSDEKVADTARALLSRGLVCTKWAHIWFSEDLE